MPPLSYGLIMIALWGHSMAGELVHYMPMLETLFIMLFSYVLKIFQVFNDFSRSGEINQNRI